MARTPVKPQIRFWKFVDKTDSCWLWRGAFRNSVTRYGMFRLKTGKNVFAHRYSYELAKGTIPQNFVIDHLCRVTSCVNPEHLEAVTIRENTLRGKSFAAINAKKTECPKGHKYNTENTMVINGHRQCRECGRIRKRIWTAKRKSYVNN